MALKLKRSIVGVRATARIYFNNEYDEYQIKFSGTSPQGNKFTSDCDYFTDDMEDAIATAKIEINSDCVHKWEATGVTKRMVRRI